MDKTVFLTYQLTPLIVGIILGLFIAFWIWMFWDLHNKNNKWKTKLQEAQEETREAKLRNTIREMLANDYISKYNIHKTVREDDILYKQIRNKLKDDS